MTTTATPAPQPRPVPQHVCFRLRVRPDAVAAYRAAHAAVWPDMLAALAETGWRDYRIHLADDGTVIGTVTVDDLDASLAGMAAREVNARWQAAMQPLLAGLERPADESFELLTPIFDLDEQLGAHRAGSASTAAPPTPARTAPAPAAPAPTPSAPQGAA